MADTLVRALAGDPVRVGTTNPAKLAAVRSALAALRPIDGAPGELVIEGVEVPSGVPEQPVGWPEIVAGARNRAGAALARADCALAVGLEDGLVELPAGEGPEPMRIFNVGCAWVTDGRRTGTGFSSGFSYPPALLGPAFAAREPIGALFDALWQARRGPSAGSAVDDPPASGGPSGRQGGNVGQLTQGRLDRSAYGAQAVLCALVPFLHVDLYD